MGPPTISADQRLTQRWIYFVVRSASMGPPTISADQLYAPEPAPGAAFRAKIANLRNARPSRAFQLPSSYPVYAQKSSPHAEFSHFANPPGFRHRFRFALLTPPLLSVVIHGTTRPASPQTSSANGAVRIPLLLMFSPATLQPRNKKRGHTGPRSECHAELEPSSQSAEIAGLISPSG